LKYGVDNYTPIRRNKDKGNDGTILNTKNIGLLRAKRGKVFSNKEGDFEKLEKLERQISKLGNQTTKYHRKIYANSEFGRRYFD
jgi:hypothetical protein